ncbi:MAG: hypothetical protein Q9160_008902 [Pyrenula sp. 1 TL-2023]
MAVADKLSSIDGTSWQSQQNIRTHSLVRFMLHGKVKRVIYSPQVTLNLGVSLDALTFLPLFEPLVREEGDVQTLVEILEKQQAILEKCRIDDVKTSNAEDLHYTTLQRLEEEVSNEIQKTSFSSKRLQMLCYDLIDLLKARYDPKGKAKWRWKAEREMKRSSNIVDAPSSEIPSQDQETSSDPKSKRKQDTQAAGESGLERLTQAASTTEAESLRDKSELDGNVRAFSDVTQLIDAPAAVFHDTALIEATYGTLAKPPTPSTSSTALRRQSFESRSRPSDHSVQDRDGRESDDALATLREDFRASEAVFGMTAL